MESAKYYLLFWFFSFIFLALCMLAAYFFHLNDLFTFGTFYIVFLLLGFAVYWTLLVCGHIGVGENFLSCFIVSTLGLFLVSIIITLISKQWGFMASVPFQIQPLSTSAPIPIINMPPEQALTYFMNVPGPVAEEAVFRIAGIRILEPALGQKKAITALSIAFGAFHYFAYGGSWIQLFIAIAAGLILGYAYAKWKSELAISLAHLSYNIVALMGLSIFGLSILR